MPRIIHRLRSLVLTLLRREAWFERTYPGKSRIIHWKGGALLTGGLAVTALFGIGFGMLYQTYPSIAGIFQVMAGASFITTLLFVWWHTN